MYLDRALSSPLLPELQKKILQASFESKGMSPAEISVIFGITETMARNHMEGLVKRGLLTITDKGNVQAYVADTIAIEKFKGFIKRVL